MIENDLPQGVLSEAKYSKTKSKLKIAAFFVWGTSILIAGMLFFSGQNEKTTNPLDIVKNQNSNQSTSVDYVAIKQELAEIESLIDQEKKVIFPTYKIASTFNPVAIGSDEYTRIENELALVDAKYIDEVQTIGNKVGVTTTKIISLDYEINNIKDRINYNESTSQINSNFKTTTDQISSTFNSASLSGTKIIALSVLAFGGMIGFVLFMASKSREIMAFNAQSTLPVMTEGMGKTVKALNDNGTVDALTDMAANMFGKMAEAQIKHNVPEKAANLQKANVEAQNKSGATKLTAEQQGKFAEEIAKGIKKGLSEE